MAKKLNIKKIFYNFVNLEQCQTITLRDLFVELETAQDPTMFCAFIKLYLMESFSELIAIPSLS